jgi:hypothetical protein
MLSQIHFVASGQPAAKDQEANARSQHERLKCHPEFRILHITTPREREAGERLAEGESTTHSLK